MKFTSRTFLLPLSLVTAAALSLSACGDTAQSAAPAPDGKLRVLASFYPLQYLTEQVGGDLVTVESITPAGAEPHDLELTPVQVERLGNADAVVYLKGFQSAVDEAVEHNSPATVIDVSGSVQLLAGTHDHDHDGHDHDRAMSDDHDHDHDHDGAMSDDHDHDGHDHDDAMSDNHDHAGHDHDHGDGKDPHFWLDPTRMGQAALVIGQSLADADPANAQAYAANAASVKKAMDDLSAELVTGTKTCEKRVFVTSHEAFGYLADRTGLEQVGISGLDPDSSPSPARLKEIAEVVKTEGVTTIFTEALIDPKVAQTLADDLGITTAVLDPIESQTDPSKDYAAVMRSNIAALRTALSCK